MHKDDPGLGFNEMLHRRVFQRILNPENPEQLVQNNKVVLFAKKILEFPQTSRKRVVSSNVLQDFRATL